MADLLVQSGQISAKRWAETLGSEIKVLEISAAADEPETFFRAVLSALERLLASDGRIIHRSWRRASMRGSMPTSARLMGNR